MADDAPNAVNQQIATIEGKRGFGKWMAAFISGIATTYIMNQLSLHGVDFALYGVSSEMIKSSLDATIITVAVGLTPTHLVAAAKDGILWFRLSCRSIKEAMFNPLP